MFDFIKRNRRTLSVVLVLLAFLLLINSQLGHTRSDNWFTATVQTIAYPIQSISHAVRQRIVSTWNHYFWLVSVQKENELLKNRVKILEEENARNREIQIAYERLRENLEFRKTNPDIKVFAEVIGERRNGASKLLIINKGSDVGVRKNFPVMTYDGIVGRVQSVTRYQSNVQLITDSHSSVPILIQRTRTKAILDGRYDGTLTIERISRDVQVLQGDRIITSGLAGIYPKGFMVGTVETVKKKGFGLFQSVTVVPAVDLNRVEEVAVILKSVHNIHQPLFTE